jgi:hypothetical protein
MVRSHTDNRWLEPTTRLIQLKNDRRPDGAGENSLPRMVWRVADTLAFRDYVLSDDQKNADHAAGRLL